MRIAFDEGIALLDRFGFAIASPMKPYLLDLTTAAILPPSRQEARMVRVLETVD